MVHRKLIFALLLAGCGSGVSNSGSPGGGAPPVLSGIVQSGGTSSKTSLGSARVVLFEATAGAPNILGSATADAQGRFSLATQKSASDTVFYVAAEVRPGVRLVNVLGPTLPNSCTINELTTVGAVYCFNQFIQNDRISGNPLALRIGAGMDENLVSAVSGASSEVLLNPPNADQTNSLRSTRALANLVADAIQRNDTATLFDLATVAGSPAPTDTVGALVNIARNPANHVSALYAQSKVTEAYLPNLERAPDAWTLCVKVNDTGDASRPFGGPANTVFDANGYAWITNNFVQGTPNGGDFDVVLKPDGQPANGLNGTPKSPLIGGGIKAGGYGLDIDPRGHIWLSNFIWGNVAPNPGSVSELDPLGHPISPDNTGHSAGTLHVQGTKSDSQNNIWMASYDNDRVVVYPAGNPNTPVIFDLPPKSQPFGVAIASDGTAWVTCSGGFQADGPCSVVHLRLDGNALTQIRSIALPTGAALKSVVVDSQDNVWVNSQGLDLVYSFNANGDLLGTFQGRGGQDSPWGSCIDGNDHVWLADFGPLKKNSVFRGRITQLAGRNAATRPPGLAPGDPMTPESGFNLPTAGQEVTLRSGAPLYNGNGPAHSFIPLMRLTSVEIDQAGNIWCANNWKPDVDVDFADTGNPGGDGMVIFLGIARPPRLRR